MDFLSPSLDASLQDLKTIYWLLIENHAEQLEENRFFDSLRLLLLEQAMTEGIDVDDKSAWMAWLSEAPAGSIPPPRELMN